MDGSDSLAVVACGVIKGILGDALRFISGDYLEALDHSRDTLMFQTTVLPLRVLTDYYNVHILVPGGRGRRKRGETGGKKGGKKGGEGREEKEGDRGGKGGRREKEIIVQFWKYVVLSYLVVTPGTDLHSTT